MFRDVAFQGYVGRSPGDGNPGVNMQKLTWIGDTGTRGGYV
jgi:hypothetical protein